MYTHLPAALLPKGFRGRGGGAPYTPRGNTSSNARGAAATRFSNLVGRMLGGETEGRTAEAAIESKLGRRVIHLDAPTSWQTEAQTAGARAGPGRAAGNAARRGLSGKRCKKVVSTVRNTYIQNITLDKCLFTGCDALFFQARQIIILHVKCCHEGVLLCHLR